MRRIMGVMRRRMVRRRMKASRVGKGKEAPAWCYLGWMARVGLGNGEGCQGAR